MSPRLTVGTVNTVEFFLTAPRLGRLHRHAGLGGLHHGDDRPADRRRDRWRPSARLLAKRISPRVLMTLVGVVLTLTSTFNLINALR